MRFALIGAAGYIAPRHMEAIKDTGNELICALDPNDSVGVLDSYFPEAKFFTDFERFDRHLNKLDYAHEPVDYISICSPNYLHDPHIRLSLRNHAHVICEKPLVLNPENLDRLQEMEEEYQRKINCVLQLRLHPELIKTKQWLDNRNVNITSTVNLVYVTSRGPWYFTSWKGRPGQSGGLAYNIGIHFFDLLIWFFGEPKWVGVIDHTADKIHGNLVFEKANVNWFLSVNDKYLPYHCKQNGLRTYRWLEIDGQEVEFSSGFTDLHTESYRQIIQGNGFGIGAARKSVQLVHQINSLIGQ